MNTTKEKVDFYERLLNSTSGIIFLNNSSNQMLWCNKRYTETFGHTLEDVNQKGLMQYVIDNFHPDDLEIYSDSIKHLSDKNLNQSLSIYRQKDIHGNWRKILVSGKVVKWSDDDFPLEGLTVGIDITDQFAEFTEFENLLKENLRLKNKLKLSVLSKRELQVMNSITHGLSTKEIAEKEHISFHTVEWHRKNISRKLKINKVSELVKFGLECGL